MDGDHIQHTSCSVIKQLCQRVLISPRMFCMRYLDDTLSITVPELYTTEHAIESCLYNFAINCIGMWGGGGQYPITFSTGNGQNLLV